MIRDNKKLNLNKKERSILVTSVIRLTDNDKLIRTGK